MATGLGEGKFWIWTMKLGEYIHEFTDNYLEHSLYTRVDIDRELVNSWFRVTKQSIQGIHFCRDLKEIKTIITWKIIKYQRRPLTGSEISACLKRRGFLTPMRNSLLSLRLGRTFFSRLLVGSAPAGQVPSPSSAIRLLLVAARHMADPQLIICKK